MSNDIAADELIDEAPEEAARLAAECQASASAPEAEDSPACGSIPKTAIP